MRRTLLLCGLLGLVAFGCGGCAWVVHKLAGTNDLNDASYSTSATSVAANTNLFPDIPLTTQDQAARQARAMEAERGVNP